jgi:REP element-mobilizing transposase RayT
MIQRGNNRPATFFAEEDYARYRDWLAEAAAAHGCAIHGFVLMTNHVHLLVTPRAPDSLPRTMQSLGRRYVRYVNTTSRRSTANSISSPAAAISSLIRFERGWSGILATIAGRAIELMRRVGPILF